MVTVETSEVDPAMGVPGDMTSEAEVSTTAGKDTTLSETAVVGAVTSSMEIATIEKEVCEAEQGVVACSSVGDAATDIKTARPESVEKIHILLRAVVCFSCCNVPLALKKAALKRKPLCYPIAHGPLWLYRTSLEDKL